MAIVHEAGETVTFLAAIQLVVKTGGGYESEHICFNDGKMKIVRRILPETGKVDRGPISDEGCDFN